VTPPGKQERLFDFDPQEDPDLKATLKALSNPIWTENKARLVERYLRYFIFITHHGTYIDGFAGKQYPDKDGCWAAKEVLALEPRWLRNFFLCDLDPDRAAELRDLANGQPPLNKEKKEQPRRIDVLEGDFNRRVDDVLASGVISDKEATFALLDQRMFECKWPTVEKLARHKRGGNKIELFYFLPVKWLHRSITSKKDLSEIAEWWGNDEWAHLPDASVASISAAATRRFKAELGYRYSMAWPIHEREGKGGAVMYYMVHASDHPEAPKLMHRAYRNALGAPEPAEQLEIAIAELMQGEG
jgi:three-Cys-motif partner protein